MKSKKKEKSIPLPVQVHHQEQDHQSQQLKASDPLQSTEMQNRPRLAIRTIH